MPLTLWCEHAWLQDGPADNVIIECDDAGRIAAVRRGRASANDVVLSGLVLPGFANVHSHAFQRALRGRSQPAASFWAWRHELYAVARRLDPDNYFRLARAVYAEMALSGITCVGEFHYVHHQPDGKPYEDPNAMTEALAAAAAAAGIRLTVIDACYLTGGIGVPLEPGQRRFSDGDVERWLERVSRLEPRDHMRIGFAIHSVRAVPVEAMRAVAEFAGNRPLHVHVSEQPNENEACMSAYGLTPTALLESVDALRPTTTVVHATHLTDDDVATLGAAGVNACLCPTTERDLGDGVGQARSLADAGATLCLGSDQNVVVDLLEEARALEMNERLTALARWRFTPSELVGAMVGGHQALGWPNAGRIAAGAWCDLVGIRLDTVRTAGTELAQAPLAATSADVSDVIASGRHVVSAGRHLLGDVGSLVAEAIEALA